MTTITSRVDASPAASNTLRVAVQGAAAAIPASYGADRWNGSWGPTWGFTWHGTNAAIPAVSASPAVDVTARISGSPSGTITKRINL